MQVISHDESVLSIEADAVVLAIGEKGPLSAPAQQLDEATSGLLTKMRASEELTGKPNETVILHELDGVTAPLICLIGVGDPSELDRGLAFRAAASAAKSLGSKRRSKVAYCLGEQWNAEFCVDGIAGAMVGCHGQDLHKSEKRLNPFETLLWQNGKHVADGQAMGEAINLCRDLVNGAPSDINPVGFVAAVEPECELHGIAVEVWDEARLNQERCGSMLAVARGSEEPPRLMKLEYRGEGSMEMPSLALVGKGVTFDSGGYSLKPSEGMKTMKCDMAGAATVVGALLAIARLKLPIHVVGFVGLVENLVSGRAYKLGDVLTARNGKTIEVLNTDAEGRLVLADVLDVAIESGARRVIDLATLTGACVVALGIDTAGLFTNDSSWCTEVSNAAMRCGEPVWELPMTRFYGDQIKSQVADIKNIGEGRWGGAITAAKFLEHFVGETPWTHIDIAGPSFLDRSKSWVDAGATGCMVRTLVDVARELSLTSDQA